MATKKKSTKKTKINPLEPAMLSINVWLDGNSHPWLEGHHLDLYGDNNASLSFGCHHWTSKKDALANYNMKAKPYPISKSSGEVRRYAREIIDWADAQFKRAGIKW